jgi:hypothetical protein
MEMVKRSVVARGWRERVTNRQGTDTFLAMELFCMMLWQKSIISVGTAAAQVDPNGDCGLWGAMLCQCRSTDCNTLHCAVNVHTGESCACVETEVFGNSLYILFFSSGALLSNPYPEASYL